MGTLVRLALRNVVRNRRRTLITLAAIIVGVGVSVTVRGLLNGLQGAFLDSVVLAQTGAVQVHRAGYLANVLSAPLTMDVPADDAFLAKIRAVPGVTSVSPRIQFAGMVSVGDPQSQETVFFQATAFDPALELATCPRRAELFTAGSRFDEDRVLLGKELAESVSAKRGSEAVLLAPDRDGAMSGELVHVGGELENAMLGEAKFGVVPLSVAQRMLKMEGRATELAVAVRRIDDAPRVAAELANILGPEYEVHTWDSVATFVRQQMSRQNFISVVVAGVFLVLMLLGVANTMLMATLERTREIGTMMAVGVRRGRIAALFLLEALGIGLAGALSGGVLGAALSTALGAHGLSFQSPFGGGTLLVRPSVTFAYVALIVLVASVGAVLFSLYPALRASRLRPVQALAGR